MGGELEEGWSTSEAKSSSRISISLERLGWASEREITRATGASLTGSDEIKVFVRLGSLSEKLAYFAIVLRRSANSGNNSPGNGDASMTSARSFSFQPSRRRVEIKTCPTSSTEGEAKALILRSKDFLSGTSSLRP